MLNLLFDSFLFVKQKADTILFGERNISGRADMAQDFETALWIKPDGLERRLSDGIPSLASLEATALHVMGWIDVQRTGMLTRVTLDPYAVRYDALMRLPDVLGTRFRGRAVDVALAHRGMSNSARISFFSTTAALSHIHEQVIVERGDLDQEPPIDQLAKGMGESKVQQERAVKPAALGWGGRGMRDTDFLRANLAEDALARPLDELEKALQDSERVARRLLGATWLDDSAEPVADLSTVLKRDEPDTVIYALHTMGWIGIEMDFPTRKRDLRSDLPARIVLDPHVVEMPMLKRLEGLCEDWGEAPGVITLVWWDGITWISECGSADQIAARARHLVTAERNAFFPSTVQSIAMEPDRLAHDLQSQHRAMIERTARIWGARNANDGGESLFQELENTGIFSERTKLVKLDSDYEFRIAQYRSGRLALWNEQNDGEMVGRRLTDVPDRHLGLRVQQDLLSVTRRGTPLVHQCYGTLSTNAGPKTYSWTRLSLPIFSHSREKVAGSVLSVCLL